MGEDTVNKLKSVAGFVGIIISMIFTWKLCKEAIGWETYDEKVITVGVSVILNIVEVVCFGFWYLKRGWPFARWACFALGCAIGLISISGSMGFFQVAIEKNVLKSEAYQAQKKRVESWQEMTDKDKNPDGYLWAATKADEATKQLADIGNSGAGVGNALYRLYAKVFGVDQFTVGLIFTFLLSASLEIFSVFSFVTSLAPAGGDGQRSTGGVKKNDGLGGGDSQPAKNDSGQPKKAKKQPESVNVDQKRVDSGKDGAIIALYKQPEYRHPDGLTPKTNKIARHSDVRTSRQYVSKVIKKYRSKGGK